MAQTKSLPHLRNRGHKPMFEGADEELHKALLPVIKGTAGMRHEEATRCVDLGLVPGALVSSFYVLKFVSRTVVIAQHLQRQYRVPASVLISLGLYESGFEAEGLGNPSGKRVCNCCSPVDQKWFVQIAKELAVRFSAALPFAPELDLYLTKLVELGRFDELTGKDLLDYIQSFGLAQLDIPALLPAGIFSRWEFEVKTDTRGRWKLETSMTASTQWRMMKTRAIAPPTETVQ